MFVKLWWISSCTSFLTSWLHVSILTDHLQVFPLQMEAGTRCYKTAIRAATQLILQDFRRFTYVTAHSPTLPSLYLRHSSFSNPSVATPTSQLILQPFFRFSYVTGFSLTSPNEPPMNGRTWEVAVYCWSDGKVGGWAEFILQHFCHFTYVTAHSPALPLLQLCHSSFSSPSFRFSYVTGSSLTSPGESPMMWVLT